MYDVKEFLPDQTSDDTDLGWGEWRDTDDDTFYLENRPRTGTDQVPPLTISAPPHRPTTTPSPPWSTTGGAGRSAPRSRGSSSTTSTPPASSPRAPATWPAS
ncbi:hypothetical protein GCM10020001_017540 [Nonomuraea salmonea]